MGFQRIVYDQPAPAVAGDFASNNPVASLVPPISGAYVVGDANVRVGYFAWGADDGKVYSSLAAATAAGHPQIGLVARQPNIPAAMITAFLGEAIMTLQVGREVTLMTAGDYWVDLPGADPTEAVFALATTGQPSLVDDATTEPTGFAAASQAKVNAVTSNATTIAANTGVMTVAAVASGVIEVGQRVTGTGVPDGTFITRQLTGAAGGAGTYATNSLNRSAVPAFTATMVQGTLAKISKAAA
jgi:hypothetical protein